MKNRKPLTLAVLTVILLLNITASAEPKIDVITTLDKRPGNPAITSDGTVYVSMHPFDKPEYKIMRIEGDEAVPYPSEDISRSYGAVIGIQATKDDTLWWLDMGSESISPKLVGWDTQANQLKAIHVIPREVGVANSFYQDFAIDEKRGKAFIADMSRGGMIDESEPAIVVVDLKTGASRRILSGNEIFQPGDNPIIAEGKPMSMRDDEGKVHELKLGLNPIAIDPLNEWVYFASMTLGSLYRMPAAILGDFNKAETEIKESMETYASKPSSDGIAAGDNGKVYITNVDENAISIADSNGTKIWAQDDRFIWTDGLYIAPDKSVVVTVNQLNRAPIFNDGKSKVTGSYEVIRISE